MRERRLPRRAGHAGLQDRLGRPDQHAAAAARGRHRQADDPLDRRRDARRRAARLRDGRRDQPAGRAAPVHGRLPGRVGGARPARDHHLPRPLPRRLSSASPATTTGSRWRSRPTCSARASSRSTSRSTARSRAPTTASRSSRRACARWCATCARTRVALGDGTKTMYPSETEPIIKMAKKLVAARDLPAGHTLTADDIALKSPGDGLPPYELDRLVGRTLRHPVREDTALTFELLEELLPEASRAARRAWRLSLARGASPSSPGPRASLGPVWIGRAARGGRRRGRASTSRPPTESRPADVTDRAALEAALRAHHRRPRRAVGARQQRGHRPAARPRIGGRGDVRGIQAHARRQPRRRRSTPPGVRRGDGRGRARLDRQHRLAVRVGRARSALLRPPPRASSSRPRTARPRRASCSSRATSRGSGARTACA